ncbi:MAG: GAF domain-containing protein [Chloroflexi bacterium]|nr:GAF domain-containing protein [Chloroflexota bacterium]
MIGNRADAVFTSAILPLIDQAVASCNGVAGIAVLVALLAICIGFVGWARYSGLRKEQGDALERSSRLLQLDDSLLRLFPNMVAAPDRSERIKRLLSEFLTDCANVFEPDVCRAMILHEEDGSLVPWVSFQMPAESLNRSRFDVSHDLRPGQKRGVAAQAYVDGELRLVHLTRGATGWQADDEEYIVFETGRLVLPYQSFVAVPIMRQENRLGVLCLDSVSPSLFDGEGTQQLLMALASRMAAAIVLYEELNDLQLSA